MTRVARPCVCSGVIEADPADDADIERAVAEHQADLRHIAYRAGAILRGELLPTEHEARVGVQTATSVPYRHRYEARDTPYKRMIRRVEAAGLANK